MKGRTTFSAGELHAIELALGELGRCDARRRRGLLRRLRGRYRFYVSDFAARNRRLTADEVERLVAQGVIRVRFA